MKAKAYKEERLRQVNQIVAAIYTGAVHTAGYTTDTTFHYEIPVVDDRYSDPFYINNMPDILAGLQELFPDCSVSHTLLAKGTNGKMYDISTLDDTTLPFVNSALTPSYIFIDWS